MSADASPDYEVLAGALEDLPNALYDHFDVVFSIAAFEHFLRLPAALEKMYRALRPGGRLFTMALILFAVGFALYFLAVMSSTLVEGRLRPCLLAPAPLADWGLQVDQPCRVTSIA